MRGALIALIARMEQLVLQEPTPWLQRITAPTLLLWGEQDAMIPLANAPDDLRLMPKARLVALPGVGHLPHEEGAASLAAGVAGLSGRMSLTGPRRGTAWPQRTTPCGTHPAPAGR